MLALMEKNGFLRRGAGLLSDSFLCRKGQSLWQMNSRQWDLPLSKSQKLLCGAYIILKDFAAGAFPPSFEDQAAAYRNEIEYNAALPGYSFDEAQKAHATKPFWKAASLAKYLKDFARIYGIFEEHGISPGAHLLELGCGSGWMAEFFAIGGYSVLGTTISPHDVALAEKKVAANKSKDLSAALRFLAWPMETVDQIPGSLEAFDCAYVYEALHHAYDWRKTVRATAKTLKPGGWLLLASEPNRLHTFVSYRVARLSKTHEIGFSRSQLVRELQMAGFCQIKVTQPKLNDWITPFWIMARKRVPNAIR